MGLTNSKSTAIVNQLLSRWTGWAESRMDQVSEALGKPVPEIMLAGSEHYDAFVCFLSEDLEERDSALRFGNILRHLSEAYPVLKMVFCQESVISNLKGRIRDYERGVLTEGQLVRAFRYTVKVWLKTNSLSSLQLFPQYISLVQCDDDYASWDVKI